MKKIELIILAFVFAIGMSSCAGTYNYSKAKSVSFSPDRVELKLTMNDYQYLGEVEISVDYKTYLGFITYTEKVNNEPYRRYHQEKYVTLKGDKDFCVMGKIKKAMYKVLETYPNADYYIPVSSVKKMDWMILGSKTNYVLTVKCYKLK